MKTVIFPDKMKTIAGDVEAGKEYLVPVSVVNEMLNASNRLGNPPPLIKQENVLAQIVPFDGTQKNVLVVVTNTGSLAIPAAQVCHFLQERGVSVSVYADVSIRWLFDGMVDKTFFGGLLTKQNVLDHESLLVLRVGKRTDGVSVAEGVLKSFGLDQAITSNLLRLHTKIDKVDRDKAVQQIRKKEGKCLGIAPLAWSQAQEWSLQKYSELVPKVIDMGFNVAIFASRSKREDLNRYLLSINSISDSAWVVDLSSPGAVAKATQECDAIVTSCEYVARTATMMDLNEPSDSGCPIFLSGPTIRKQWEMGIVAGMAVHSQVHCSGCDIATVCPFGSPSPCLEHITVQHVIDAINNCVPN